MKHSWIALGCSALSHVATLASAAAQPPAKRVSHRVSCPTCIVELTPVTTIGGRSDTVSIAATSSLDRDSQGRIFAISDDYRVLVYDSRGRLVKALGRRGDGPGEFNALVPGGIADVVVGASDTVFVFHPPKVTVFSPTLAYVRTIPLVPVSGIKSAHQLAGGVWLVAGSNNTRDHAGRPFFFLNPDGSIRRSFGPEQTLGQGRLHRAVLPFKLSPDGRSLWMNDGHHRYALTQWGVDGRLLASLQIDDVPFLPEPTIVTQRAPSGRVFQVEQGGDLVITGVDTLGHIWAWGKAPEAKPSEGVLEILDPRSGEILVSQKMQRPVSLLRNGSFAYIGSSDADGFITLTVSRYRVVAR